MSGHEDARRLLAQLRAQTHASLGISDSHVTPTVRRRAIDLMLQRLSPAQRADRHLRRLMKRAVSDGQTFDDIAVATLVEAQQKVETIVAAVRGAGTAVPVRRPVIGHLRTGQLNAVSMRVPGESGAYLVLFEDQLTNFVMRTCAAAAWAIPCGPSDTDGMVRLGLTAGEVAERVRAAPEVVDYFADIVTSYAVTGRIELGTDIPVREPALFNLMVRMSSAINYFVLGHEYAHILAGHLDATGTYKGVLHAADAEVLAYSWNQELDADLMGLFLALNTIQVHESYGPGIAFLGIGLYFDVLDVMDRAVALLQTGDENARQLGSHPPPTLRRLRLRAQLPFGHPDPVTTANMRKALEVADAVQGQIIRLLWDHLRPILLDLRRRGVPAARTWRTIPKESGGIHHADHQ